MPKTVLIILAAVVALIVIVVLTGMRYLRADDEDDFDDEVPAEHGRSRSRGSHLPHELHRSRRHHDEDLPDERLRERPGAVRVGAGRGADRDPGRAAAGRGRDMRGSDDRGWRADSGPTARAGRPPSQRDQRPVRSPSRPDDDMPEPAAASARSGRSRAGRGREHGLDDYESRSGRMPSAARDYEREGADGRGGRDRPARDDRDLRDRRDARESGDVRDARDGRESRDARDGRDVRERRDVRAAAGTRENAVADRDERDRRSTTRPNARQEGRKNSAADDRGELLPPVKPRQGRGKRDADGDWPSNEWDELSDVDYWAELASDKPLTTLAPAEKSRPERGESRLDGAAAPARAERKEVGSGRESLARQASRPARHPDPVRQPDPALVPSVTRKPDLAATDRSEDFSGTGSHRASLGRTEQLQAVPAAPAPGRDSRPAGPLDDDPLTSPSFPRITADDSRTYRRSRTAGSDDLQPASRATEAAPHRPAHPDSQAQNREPAYPAVPPAEPLRGLEGSSPPHSYPRPAAGGSGYGAASPGYERPAADYERPAADYAGSVADPYRTTTPASPVPSGYQVPVAASTGRYGTDGYSGASSTTAGYSVPAGTGGYAVPGGSAHGGPVSGYPAGADSGAYPSAAGNGAGGYRESGGTAASYPPAATGHGGETVIRGTYPAAVPEPRSYQSPASDPGSYQSSLPSGGRYQADPGIGGHSAAAASSYALPAGPAGYPGQADRPVSYQGFADSGSASGSQLRPDPGYLAGGYPASAEPVFHGTLPSGQAGVGYPVYPAPVPVSPATAYQFPDAPLPAAGPDQAPGYQDAQYRPDIYDPPGYHVPAPETGGYAGADPYAMDPYGYSGYGSGGH